MTLVAVKVSALDATKLVGDIDHTLVDDWQESLSETDQCMYRGAIPAELLVVTSPEQPAPLDLMEPS